MARGGVKGTMSHAELLDPCTPVCQDHHLGDGALKGTRPGHEWPKVDRPTVPSVGVALDAM